MKKLNVVRKWSQGYHKKIKKIRHKLYRRGAAVCISAAYRSYVIRERLVTLLYWNKFTAAIEFQRIYRGYKARVVYRGMQKAKKDKEILHNLCATRIQSIIRMVLAIRQLDILVKEKQIRIEEKIKLKEIKMKNEVLIKDNLFVDKENNIVILLFFY